MANFIDFLDSNRNRYYINIDHVVHIIADRQERCSLVLSTGVSLGTASTYAELREAVDAALRPEPFLSFPE